MPAEGRSILDSGYILMMTTQQAASLLCMQTFWTLLGVCHRRSNLALKSQFSHGRWIPFLIPHIILVWTIKQNIFPALGDPQVPVSRGIGLGQAVMEVSSSRLRRLPADWHQLSILPSAGHLLVPSPVSSSPPLSSCELLHTCLSPSVVHAPLTSSEMPP